MCCTICQVVFIVPSFIIACVANLAFGVFLCSWVSIWIGFDARPCTTPGDSFTYAVVVGKGCSCNTDFACSVVHICCSCILFFARATFLNTYTIIRSRCSVRPCTADFARAGGCRTCTCKSSVLVRLFTTACMWGAGIVVAGGELATAACHATAVCSGRAGGPERPGAAASCISVRPACADGVVASGCWSWSYAKIVSVVAFKCQ